MAQLTLTPIECKTTADALGMAITSAGRAQKSGKSPQIVEVYLALEGELKELQAKFIKAAATK